MDESDERDGYVLYAVELPASVLVVVHCSVCHTRLEAKVRPNEPFTDKTRILNVRPCPTCMLAEREDERADRDVPF